MKVTEKRTFRDLTIERSAEFDGSLLSEVELFRELRAWLTERVHGTLEKEH